MAQKINDLCVATGHYTTSNGEEKTIWENIGAELLTDDNKQILLLKPWINLAGIPHQMGQHISVMKFSVKKKATQNQLEKQQDSSTEDFPLNIY